MTIPAGSAFETEQAEKARQAEVALSTTEVVERWREEAEVKALPTKATASAIELGTFEAGHDESDLIAQPKDFEAEEEINV